MQSQHVEFLGSQGVNLAGRLQRPDGEPRGWALFAHCFTCSKDSRAAVHVTRALVEAGFGVLRFDFTGLGGSGGDFANTSFSSNVEDLVAAADWLRAEHGVPALLIGHSLGGAAVLAAAEHIEDAAAVATIGAPFDPRHVSRQFGQAVDDIESDGEAEVELAGRRFTVRRAFLQDLNSQNQAERIRKLRRPLMVLHAPGDTVVPIDNASGIFQTALHPKSFVSLDDADHLLTHQRDARFAADVMAAWAGRYVAATDGAKQASDDMDAADDGAVHVSERGSGAYSVAIRAGRHTWVGDEPEAVGGDDAGPDPYQMLNAALGACTAMTLRMYANRKQWPLDNVHVTLTHAKIHARDCAECETTSGRIDRIERRIRIDGELDEEQRARLMEIADKCPVHRTLHSEVQVVTHAD